MVAIIERAWSWSEPGTPKRLNVRARDINTGTITRCHVWMQSFQEEGYGTLCLEAAQSWRTPKPRLVLTLCPPDAQGWCEIEKVEPLDSMKAERTSA